jgi:hypothetical protein
MIKRERETLSGEGSRRRNSLAEHDGATIRCPSHDLSTKSNEPLAKSDMAFFPNASDGGNVSIRRLPKYNAGLRRSVSGDGRGAREMKNAVYRLNPSCRLTKAEAMPEWLMSKTRSRCLMTLACALN